MDNSSKLNGNNHARQNEVRLATASKKDSEFLQTTQDPLLVIEKLSNSILEFSRISKTIEQKTALFGTSRDNRTNHVSVNELIDQGKRLSIDIQRTLEHIMKEKKDEPRKRVINAQCRKLSTDFRSQLANFEAIVKKAVASEQSTVEYIRRTSTRLGSSLENSLPNKLTNFSEDQIYSQTEIQEYDEDALQRREDDIIHITKQLAEVADAYKKIDQIIMEQDEVIENIVADTDAAREDVEDGLQHIAKANTKASYCACSKAKLICLGAFTVITLIVVLSLIAAFKHY